MTKFTDLQIGKVGAPDGSSGNFASIDSSGRALFSNRVIVGATAATVDTSGTATFTGGLVIGASDATIDASGTATFEGPVKGPAGVGLMELVQRVTVVDQNSASNPVEINLPSGADITEINFFVEVQFTASASAQTGELVVYLGGAGGPSALSTITETRVSASGAYDCLDILSGSTTLNMARLRNITATVKAILTAKNIATAYTGGGQGMLQIRYVHNA